MELLQREIFKIQNTCEKDKLHLEAENRDISAKLKTFENLEKELDSVVLHIADDDENDPEQMLRNFGIGGNMPTNSRRRMQQSVRLAKRALNLERISVDKTREIDVLKDSNTKLKEQVSSLEAAMEGVNQPYSYLVQSAADKDSTIAQLKEKLKKQHRFALRRNQGRVSKNIFLVSSWNSPITWISSSSSRNSSFAILSASCQIEKVFIP